MMKIVKMIPLAASLVSILMVSACSDNNDNSQVAPTAGVVFDGAINGATVCIDVNGNGLCDAGEASAVTDVFGNFSIDGQGAKGPLVMSGGKDMGTGLPFTGVLSAPAGSTVVNPTTSIIQSLVKAGSTAAEAETTIKKALGIKSDAALTSYNPFTAADAGDPDAKEILAAQSQLQTLVHAVASSVAGVDAGTSIADAMSDAVSNIAASLESAVKIAGDKDVVISNKLISDAVKATANTVLADKPAAQVAVKAVADSVAILAVSAAILTKENVEKADIKDIAIVSDTGIIVANDTMQTAITKSSASARVETEKLTVEDVAKIQAAQAAQEAVEAKIAAEALQVALKIAEKIAADKALEESATQANIVAAQEAAAAQAQAEAKKAQAEADAAAAKEKAANLEIQIAATEAKAKQEAAILEQAEADAVKAQAEAEQAAAEQAAKDAADAADAAAAAQAAAEAEAAHAAAIKAAKDAADVAAEQAAAEAAAKDAAAKAAAEEAALEAEQAAKDAKIAKEAEEACNKDGGKYNPDSGECVIPPIPTGGNS
ncbi:hypothetical protein JHD49_03320 [Sulfurimonas sp. SAG-AH-194-C21]|nr:hypothetical protein [Sulfurimonas sp. SAG-AH-194-C21]MDF1882963.1 hypothetical protein [Sulfurimonas sp. SAG-AH-194-C21]